MTTIFFRYARLSILAVFLLAAAGAAAFFTLGRQEDPSLVERFGLIVTPYPGASAERVEALVTDPVERAVRELAEVDEVRSYSRSGVSVINLSMREDLSEAQVDQAWTRVREQVNSVRPVLPRGAGAPDVRRQYIGASTLIVALTWPDGEPVNMAILSRLARDLEDRLRNLSGTDETRVYGAAEEEIRILADPDTLAGLGLTVADLAALVARADSRTPAGLLHAEGVDLNVEIAGAFDTVDRIRAVPVARDGAGRIVRLADIADVEKGARTPAATMAFSDGRRAVFVAAFLQPDLRVDQWTARTRAAVDAFEAETPGVGVDILFAQADYVERRLNGLAVSLAWSGLIVFAVLFLIMGWRAALIVGSALPLTVLAVLFLIALFDEPLHQMSVTGLVVALGLLIDNAIVVVDEYQLMRAKGLPPLDAINRSLKHLFAPLLASTLTTVFAFAPIALMPGSAGEFISMIGVSVIFAVGASFVLAMTVIPAFAGWFDDGRAGRRDGPFWRDGLRSAPLAALYRRGLDVVIARPWIGIVAGIALPLAGFYAASTLPLQFFPATDRDMFQVEMVLPPNASIAETQRQTERATALIESYPGVVSVNWVLGESPPRTYYNVIGTQSGVPNYAAGWVRMKSASATARILPALQDRVREAFPQARFLTLPYEQGPPVRAPIELILTGPELAELDRLGQEIRAVLATSPLVTATVAELQTGEPTARIVIDEASAALAGIRLDDLANRLRADFDGAAGGSVLEGVEELPVRVIATDARRASVASLGGAPIPGEGAGAMASVGALGEVRLEPAVAVIPRLNGERVNQVYGFLAPFTLPDPVLRDVLARLDANGIVLPPGYRMQIGGEAAERGDAVSGLLGTALPLIILMVGSVVLAFNSFRYAGIIFAVGALSVGLALFGVWLFGSPLGFNAIVGSMGLVGLSINGSIVVLSALKTTPAALAMEPGAIRDTVFDATRHIIATTLTTIGGFAPLLIGGDSFWIPFAAAVAGGVAGSALLALIFAPAAFVMLARLRARRLELQARLTACRSTGALIQPAE